MSPFARELCERSKDDRAIIVGSEIRQLGNEIEAAEAKASRYDEALLRIYLSAMPLGKYHAKHTNPSWLYCDGVAIALIDASTPYNKNIPRNEGLVAALVHLLNAREQTEIPR